LTILNIIHQLRDKVKKWLPITLIISIVAGGTLGFLASCLPTQYSAYAKIFPLSVNDSRGGTSPIDMIQAQFGIQKSGTDMYDIEELIKSKRLSFKILNSPSPNKKYKKFADWIIAENNEHMPFFYDSYEMSSDTADNLIFARNLILGKISVSEAESGYTTISVKSYDKELSKEITEEAINTLSEFYIQFVTEKPRTDLYRISKMRDSLNSELNAVSKAIAGIQDQSAFAVKSYVGLPRIKLERKQQEITAVYSTTVQALQNAKFKLLSESPIFQILDYPGEPYDSIKTDWKKFALVGFLLSFVLLNLWFCRKVFFNIIIEELKKA